MAQILWLGINSSQFGTAMAILGCFNVKHDSETWGGVSALRLFPLALLLFTSDIAMVTTLTLIVHSCKLQPTNHRDVARKKSLPFLLDYVDYECT